MKILELKEEIENIKKELEDALNPEPVTEEEDIVTFALKDLPAFGERAS